MNTVYTVTVTIGNCTDTASATVSVVPGPTVTVSSNVTITQGQTVSLTATGGGTYSWNNGATNSVITVSPMVNTGYCVTVSNGSCIDTACVTVTVEPVDCSPSATGELFLPNAFSPNTDGENDVLKIYFGNMYCIESLELHIYNRWGEKVFETTDPNFKWDGSYKNKMEGTEVFVYYMKAELISGDKIVKKGNISLVR